MSSVLERPELNKIFLLYGNLDDMFMSPDLQKNNFRPFLNQYLRSLGYRQIVYYSGAKNVGKFVLDDESAVLAINKRLPGRRAERRRTGGRFPVRVRTIQTRKTRKAFKSPLLCSPAKTTGEPSLSSYTSSPR